MVVTLEILHIALAAAWFGHKLLIPADVRASMTTKQSSEAETFLRRMKRAERLGQITGIGTLAAGIALAYAVDASTVGYGVWAGATLVVAAIVIGAVFARPASKQLRSALTAGDRPAAVVAGHRLNRTLGLESLLWLGALAGMVIA